MKKILSMLLCLVLACGVLASCDKEREYGSYLPNYGDYVPEVDEKLTINLYIITEKETALNAQDTVALYISLHTARKYNTDLQVHYLTSAQYESNVIDACTGEGEDAANIILITGPDMMREFAKGTELGGDVDLVELSGYLQTTDFGALNVNIAPALLESAKNFGQGNLYAIPNNRIVGEYEYVLISKWANDEYNIIPPSMFDNDLGPDDLTGLPALIEELEKALEKNGKDPDDYIKYKSGSYELQEELEADGEFECIVTKNPTVTSDIAFSSAFAIVDRGEDYNYKAMEMIYAINMDPELRDLLQYGVADINYTVDENGDIVSVKSPTTTYKMKLEYTGNVFMASYSSQIGWTETVANNGKLQNAEAVAEKIAQSTESTEKGNK